jgi:spore coat protein U-like protein
MRRMFFALLALMLFSAAGAARADGCSVTMSDVNFVSVSPISSSNFYANGTGSVTCTWALLSATPPFILLFPNVQVCINAGLGSNSTSSTPRDLGNGSNLLDYNLYRDSSYAAASIWGGPSLAATPTPISFTMTAPNLLTGGTLTTPFTVYGRIVAGAALTGVKTVGNSDTVYSSNFSGAATITYAYYNLIAPGCTTGSSSSFGFQATATVINNCTISTTPIAFGSNGVLTAALRKTGTLSVQCVNNNAYQIALNGGTVAGSVAGRQMKNSATNEKVSYRVSATLDGPLWGDGSGGTTLYSGTGNGAVQTVTMYGMVPVQGTPTPGDYKDTVTATIYF